MSFDELKNKPLKASRKTTGKDGKTYWNQCGLTVWLGDYNGQPQVSLVDERTGERYPCFPPKPRNEQQFNQGQTPPTDDEVPF
jgi:hypothetical protein